MPINPNPTIRQRRLARALRELRVAAGLKHSDAATALGCNSSKMTRLENAQSGIRSVDLRILLDLYGVTDEGKRTELEALAKVGNQKGWWTRYGSRVDSAYAAYGALEQDASDIYNVETNLIPGLLQTPAYTEALIRLQVPDASDDDVQTQVQVRAERRKLLARAVPLQLWVVVAESVLRTRVGTAETMHAQLEFLLAASLEPNIELQVLRGDDPINACLYGPFVIMSFPNPGESDVVYTDSNTSTAYYEEPDDVETYTRLFRRLNLAACGVDESRRVISMAMTEMVQQ
ncbi:helix-turn-helix domain-containing protein [Kitasatospora sp. NPDC058048]|uniref:helix-turn-helix domain-containing protein n=1 Tax=Kitasatospora sp. NPDC058048 TaxID=3346313 RepID=UPI0036DC8498